MPTSAPTLVRNLMLLVVGIAGVAACADFFGPPLLGPVQPAVLAFAMVGWMGLNLEPDASRLEHRIFRAGVGCAALLAAAGVAELLVA